MCLVKHKIYAFVKKNVFCKSTKYMCYYNDTKYTCFALTQNICVLQKYKIDLSGKTQDMCVQHTVLAKHKVQFDP